MVYYTTMKDLNIKDIINVYQTESKNWMRQNFSPRAFDAVVFFTDGEIEYRFFDKFVTAQKGDVLFLPKDVPYSGMRHTDTVAYFVLDFLCVENSEFEHFGAPAVFTPKNYNLTLSKFSSAAELWNKQQIDALLKLKSIVYSIISEFLESSTLPKTVALVDDIVEYIIKNLHDPSLKVSVLCSRFFISESQLRRNFIKATGSNPNEYILTLRINRAKTELLCTKKSIKQIASECGFSSPYYFSRCFSEMENETPTAYRKKHSFM